MGVWRKPTARCIRRSLKPEMVYTASNVSKAVTDLKYYSAVTYKAVSSANQSNFAVTLFIWAMLSDVKHQYARLLE